MERANRLVKRIYNYKCQKSGPAGDARGSSWQKCTVPARLAADRLLLSNKRKYFLQKAAADDIIIISFYRKEELI